MFISSIIKRIVSHANTILYLLYALLIIVTPFIVYHKTSELFEFNKMLFIYTITGCVASVWILKMIAYQKIILKKTLLDPFILLFFSSQVLSTIISFDKHTSLFGYYGRFNGGLLSLFCFIVLYYAFVSNITTVFYKARVIKLLQFSLISSIVIVLWGLSGWFGHDLSCLLFTGVFDNSCWTESFKPALRMFSTLGQPNWLGAYLSINIFICLYFLKKAFDKYNSFKNPIVITYFISLFLLFGGILATKSRSSMLAVSVGLLLYVYPLLLKEGKNYVKNTKLYKLIGLICITGVLAVFIFKTGIPKIDNIILAPQNSTITKNISVNEKSTKVTESFDIRKIVWRGAFDLGLRYPLFGTGVETFGYSYYFTRPISHNLTSEWDYLYNRAHNEYLNFFATSGLFGLISYILLIVGIFKLFFHSYKKLHNSIVPVTVFCAWITILITNFFGFSTSTISIYFYLLPAFLIAYSTDFENEKMPVMYSGIKQSYFMIPFLVFFASLLYIFSYFKADTNYNLGVAHFDSQNYPSAIEYLEKGLVFKYEHVYEDKLALAYAQTAVITSLDTSIPQHKTVAQKLIDKAISYNKRSIEASSKNILYLKTKAKVYYFAFNVTNNPNYFEKAINALQTIEELAPSEPKAPYTLALFYDAIYDGTTDQNTKKTYLKHGLEAVKRAIKIKPNYRDAYFLQGNLYVKQNDILKARESYTYILSNLVPNDLEAQAELKKIQ